MTATTHASSTRFEALPWMSHCALGCLLQRCGGRWREYRVRCRDASAGGTLILAQLLFCNHGNAAARPSRNHALAFAISTGANGRVVSFEPQSFASQVPSCNCAAAAMVGQNMQLNCVMLRCADTDGQHGHQLDAQRGGAAPQSRMM